MIWNHLALLVIITLVGLLIGTSNTDNRIGSTTLPEGVTRMSSLGQSDAKSAGVEGKSGWMDQLPVLAFVIAFMAIKFLRGEQTGVAAAAT